MIDVFFDALFDTLKLLPYLFVTFLFLEYVEHKLSKKGQKILFKYKKLGPVIGGILGGFPQCGFSAMATSLYTSKVITMGSIVSIFLATSDEMLAIMLGENISFLTILKIIVFKVMIGIIVGFIVDVFYKSKKNNDFSMESICDDEHCHCKESLLLSSLIHTLKTVGFVLFANLLINIIIYFVGDTYISNILTNNNIFVYFIASLIGLIPNCAASIVITKVYLANLISLGTLLSGLLTGSGIGILLLFKNNKSLKENLTILGIIYFVGVITGLIIDLILLK